MQTMEQYWPGLRTITLPRVTIMNIAASNQQSHVTSLNFILFLINQIVHRTVHQSVAVHHLRLQRLLKRVRERRSASQKRSDCCHSRTIGNMASQQTRNSPSSNPPPNKKVSNEKVAPTSKLSHLKKVVSEASVQPPPPSPQQQEPSDKHLLKCHHVSISGIMLGIKEWYSLGEQKTTL